MVVLRCNADIQVFGISTEQKCSCHATFLSHNPIINTMNVTSTPSPLAQSLSSSSSMSSLFSCLPEDELQIPDVVTFSPFKARGSSSTSDICGESVGSNAITDPRSISQAPRRGLRSQHPNETIYVEVSIVGLYRPQVAEKVFDSYSLMPLHDIELTTHFKDP